MKKDSETKPDKPAFDPKDLVDEPIPDVYGPPEWYDNHSNLDNNHPSTRRFKERIKEIEERNRQRRMQREREALDCDERIMNVYAPMPPGVDDFSVRIPEEEGRDEDKKMGKKEAAKNRRGFLARLFGKKHS